MSEFKYTRDCPGCGSLNTFKPEDGESVRNNTLPNEQPADDTPYECPNCDGTFQLGEILA